VTLQSQMTPRREQAERLRGYFELQLIVATRIAEAASLTLSDACLRFTNLHRRFGMGRAWDGVGAPEWPRYAIPLERMPSIGERLEWTLAFFAEAPPDPASAPVFGCFRFDPPDEDGAVRIHFSNRDSADGVGPLARDKSGRRLAELAQMCAHLRARYPAAARIQGGSWLYNLDAYCRLFPPDYIASRAPPDTVRLDGTSTWGQALDHREQVKPGVRRHLLEALDDLDPAAPWRIFPMRALKTTAPIETFHRFYG